LYIEKHRITDSKTTVEVVVKELPLRAGVDPYNKLVDRNSDDNVKKVSEASAGSEALSAASR
ncbi:MAG: hypothetical protein O7A63_10990, partial [Acidobacteria bacterium]|nr:hypothetical protein [Acidobacteriota bacterium]